MEITSRIRRIAQKLVPFAVLGILLREVSHRSQYQYHYYSIFYWKNKNKTCIFVDDSAINICDKDFHSITQRLLYKYFTRMVLPIQSCNALKNWHLKKKQL